MIYFSRKPLDFHLIYPQQTKIKVKKIKIKGKIINNKWRDIEYMFPLEWLEVDLGTPIVLRWGIGLSNFGVLAEDFH